MQQKSWLRPCQVLSDVAITQKEKVTTHVGSNCSKCICYSR